MNLGYHYHIPYKKINDEVYLPSYFGLFIDELAKNCSNLYLFLFEQPNDKSIIEDYKLLSSNIKLVSLGKLPTFYHRLLWPFKFIDIVKKNVTLIDHFIIRTPTPLSAYLYWSIHRDTKVSLMIVGDYIKSLPGLKQPFFRKKAIIILMYYYQYLHLKTIKRANVIVNSPELKELFKPLNNNIKLVRTTTLSSNIFYSREDTCNSQIIKVLYTGRISLAKGLKELLNAIAILNQKLEKDFELHLVGWEDPGQNIVGVLNNLAQELQISNRLFFHGKKRIGEELNSYYRMADIYVIPSYHEGFPRTIWEALSQSTPVIATHVGGIPYYLKNKENALLIEPKSVNAIVEAVISLINDQQTRKQLITNGLIMANEITLERQTLNLLNSL